MNAREAIASAIHGNEWQNRWELASTIITQLSAAGFTIMSKEAVEAVRDNLEHVTELLIDTWHSRMGGDPEMQVAISEARAAIRSLKSGGRDE